MTPAVDSTAMLSALAALLAATGKAAEGLDVHRALVDVFTMRRAFSSPGKIVPGEKPLTVGTLVNFRRGFPSGKHPDDLGWYCAGYLRKRDDRWCGYIFVQLSPYLQSRTAPDVEAFDVLEPREVLP